MYIKKKKKKKKFTMALYASLGSNRCLTLPFPARG